MKNKRLLAIQKQIETASLASGGLLNAEDADKFITLTVDQSAILSEVLTYKMTTPERNIDVLTISQRQLRKKEEGVDPGNRGAIGSYRNVLKLQRAMLPIEVTDEVLESNIEGEAMEETLMGQFALATGNDVADLAWNGDEASGDPFLSINDGWLKKLAAVAPVHDHDSVVAYPDVFKEMLKLLPARYKWDRSRLVYYCSANDEDDYRDFLAARQTAMGDAYLDSERNARYKGIPVKARPYIPDGTFLLTDPKNLGFGMGFLIQIENDRDIFKGMNQHAITVNVDFGLATNDGTVLSYDAP